jgi:hypothetical protein
MRPWWNARTKGIYIYSLTPFAQKAFYGFFSHDIKELIVRGLKGSLVVLPIVLGSYGLLSWANHDYHRRIRKNPAEFEISEHASA